MKLEQVATISPGHPFRGKIPEVSGMGVVAVQMKDVSLQTGIQWQSCHETELISKREPDWLQPGDILFASRGSHNYAVLITASIQSIDAQAVASPHFYVMSCKRKDILPEYLVWLLNQAPCQRYFEQNAEGTLTKSIRRSVLANTPIAMPDLRKQRAIIGLAETFRQEKQIVERLLQNGEKLLNTIALDLINESKN